MIDQDTLIFTERYGGYTDDRLIDVLAAATDYQPAAVAAARQELARRGLRGAALEIAIRQRAGAPTGAVGPVQRGERTVGKKLLALLIILAYTWVNELFYSVPVLTYFFPVGDLLDAAYLTVHGITLLLAPPAALLFWWRRRAGWTLMAGLGVFQSGSLALSCMASVRYYLDGPGWWPASGGGTADLSGLIDLLAPAHPLQYVPPLAVYAAYLWLLLGYDVRTACRAHPQDTVGAVIAGLALTLSGSLLA